MTKKDTSDQANGEAAESSSAKSRSKNEPPPLGVAQSEIGPTTYKEGGEVIYHGEDDKETQRAYAAGHPAESPREAADDDDTPDEADSDAGPDDEADTASEEEPDSEAAEDEAPAEATATRTPRAARSAAPARRSGTAKKPWQRSKPKPKSRR